MKHFYSVLAVMAAILFPNFGAKALTVDDIVGTYNASDIDFSQNYGVFMGSTLSDLNSVSWEMTITVVEGNRVKLTNFIKKGINYGMPSKEGVFDIEGVFDPATSTITLEKTSYSYPMPGFGMITLNKTISKYDGETEFGSNYGGEFENFTAKFDSSKNLTVDPWAVYDTSSKKVNLLPYYTRLGSEKIGTRFTFAGASGIQDVEADQDAPVEYFNLQGMKVENPENGMYIRRQGNKVQKVIIR